MATPITPGMLGHDLKRADVIDKVRNAYNEVSFWSGEEESGGGVFYLIDRRIRKTVARTSLGNIPPGKKRKRSGNATRKVKVVCRRGTPDLVGSYTYRSADPEHEAKPVWGGGVKCRRYAAAFSGMSEHMDELLVCVVLFRLGLLEADEARAIFVASNNVNALKQKWFQKFFGMVC